MPDHRQRRQLRFEVEARKALGLLLDIGYEVHGSSDTHLEFLHANGTSLTAYHGRSSYQLNAEFRSERLGEVYTIDEVLRGLRMDGFPDYYAVSRESLRRGLSILARRIGDVLVVTTIDGVFEAGRKPHRGGVPEESGDGLQPRSS